MGVVIRSKVVCGRKSCSRCGRWRHAFEFGVSHRWPDGSPKWLQSRCKTCELFRKREANGYQRKQWLSKAERRARKREWRKRWRAHPVMGAHRREYERIYKEMQRRAAGIAPRPLGSRAVRAPDIEAIPRLDGAPFAGWLEGQLKRYESLDHMAVALGVDESGLRKIMSGGRGVLLDTVDRCLTRAGEPFLLEQLYPELFDFEDERVAA